MSKKTIFTGSALTAVGSYLALCSFMYLRQRQLLYRPAKPTSLTPKSEEVIARQGSHPALLGWVDRPGQEKALVYFGGASEPVEFRRKMMFEHFPDHTLYFVPYCGFGPNFHLACEEAPLKFDALRLVNQIAKQHPHIDLVGRSLGTGIAVHVASQIPVQTVGLITPYDSILEVARNRYKMLPITHMLQDRFESWKDASKVTAPVLACLAETDTVVPWVRTKALLKYFPQVPSQCVIENVNHTTIADSQDLWHSLSGFFLTQSLSAHRNLEVREGDNAPTLVEQVKEVVSEVLQKSPIALRTPSRPSR